MSMRARSSGANQQVEALQKELQDCKQAAMETSQSVETPAATEAAAEGAKTSYDQLTPTEQSAANLGVSPDAWKPIGFMNNAHYDTLIKSNALDDDLARRIEAYRTVASTSS